MNGWQVVGTEYEMATGKQGNFYGYQLLVYNQVGLEYVC
jgi:hypothetical protein